MRCVELHENAYSCSRLFEPPIGNFRFERTQASLPLPGRAFRPFATSGLQSHTFSANRSAN
jgi:hypothetical protein